MERGEPSSDDDEDLQTLIPNHRSTFEIDPSSSPAAAAAKISARNRYCLIAAISLPLLLLLLIYFSLFNRIPIINTDSELKALYLLRNQQTSLLNLWSKTLPGSNRSGSSTVQIEQLRTAILDQIKTNRQIQMALLSSNATSDGNVGPDLASYGVDVCKKVGRSKDRRTIEWRPKKDRFLLAICLSGQMSNHLICLEKHMFIAAVLDRVLVFPSDKLDYKYGEVLDLNHINGCFGRKVVVSYDEFVEERKNKLKIDRFICYIASPPCFMDDEHVKKLKGLGVSLGEIEVAWPEDVKSKEQKKRVVGDIKPKFSSEDEVIAIGDMFYADLEEEWVMQPGGPLAHKCKTLIQPSRLIVLTAQRFVQTFLGSNFVALHFRRHGFLKFCNMKEESCFFPIPQAAACILRVIDRSNAPIIYLSTDAAESETDLLRSLLVSNDGRPIPLVKRPGHNSSEKWDALLYRNHLGENSQVEAMLDKTICAMSNVFIGAPGSTFTEDIFRVRRGWGAGSQCDEYLCHGEKPNFVADDE